MSVTFTIFLVLSVVNFAYGFDITYATTKQEARPGENVTLTCKSDSYFEYCKWIHKSKTCSFEWKHSKNAVVKSQCNEFPADLKYVGNYDEHECKIMFLASENLNGLWLCEMEQYVFGSIRGTAKSKFLNLHLSKDPDTTTTITTSTTTIFTTTTSTTTTTQAVIL